MLQPPHQLRPQRSRGLRGREQAEQPVRPLALGLV